MIQDILLQKAVLKNTISKSDNNKRILAPNDNNKQHFLCSNLMSWPGLCKSDNIKRMITLTMITLSGTYCTLLALFGYLIKEGALYSLESYRAKDGSYQWFLRDLYLTNS